jgi:hypothetical protein
VTGTVVPPVAGHTRREAMFPSDVARAARPVADAYFSGRLGGTVNARGGTVKRSSIPWACPAAGRVVLTLLAIVVIAGSTLSAGTGSAAAVPLRLVDWAAVLENDPAITIDRDAYALPGKYKPYISVAAPWVADGTLSGYALLEDVLYGNLDASGAEEAIVPIYSGGTAGMLGFLLYREADPAPRLALVRTGYKLGVSTEGTRVVISEPYYVGFEANCCPSAVTRTVHALDGDQLVMLSSEIEPNDVQESTVWSFYRAISERRYDEAYEFYSPAFQAANPFNQWRAGYADTQSIEVETATGRTPAEVLIQLTATDNRPGGGTITRRFKGSWALTWSPEKKRWLLDKASIQPT